MFYFIFYSYFFFFSLFLFFSTQHVLSSDTPPPLPLCRQIEWSSFVYLMHGCILWGSLYILFPVKVMSRMHGTSINETWCPKDIEDFWVVSCLVAPGWSGGTSKHILRISVPFYICFHDYFNYPWENSVRSVTVWRWWTLYFISFSGSLWRAMLKYILLSLCWTAIMYV